MGLKPRSFSQSPASYCPEGLAGIPESTCNLAKIHQDSMIAWQCLGLFSVLSGEMPVA
ncbi:hypothetical protein [Methylocaldum sp. 14B]|jgi:hypothetical protein|uniref:hypothetical protein n=1 Tax=unclassified Methylocaldum TaxID=2622260 RepID=UPI00143B56D5|nr:hypothetical protein [Methylocaldum sp. 14B]MDV3241731.1 hypothetical protein [Methylocaldum sp.]